jgi:TetR/AcrR family tetracycline transcriptional repressor
VPRRPSSGPLTPDAIIEAAQALLRDDGHGSFTLRDLGEALGVHNTADYRHFRDKQELLRAVADRVLADVAVCADDVSDPFEAVSLVCTTLRATLLERPAAARVLAEGPARQPNELRLTETLLNRLRQTGLDDRQCVDASHALIEYSVGSAVLDHPLASLPATERAQEYRRWRGDYLGLPTHDFPTLVAPAPLLYQGASDQFAFGLGLMLDSLRRLAEGEPARAQS